MNKQEFFVNFLTFCTVLRLGRIKAEPFAKQLTIYVEAGHAECLYHPLAQSEKLFIEYQVIDGGRAGELDINFLLLDPHRVVIVKEEQKETSKHQYTSMQTGVYCVCFDNSFSSFNRKTVSFMLEVVAVDAERKESEYWRREMVQEYHMDQALTDIRTSVTHIHLNLMRSRQLQDLLRTHEARDRNVIEGTCSLVYVWSLVQFISMICVGLLQVYMLRSIFDINARFHNVWRKF